MRISASGWRTARLRQRAFAFFERKFRRERQFKRAILAATGLVLVAILQAFPLNDMLSASFDSWAGRTLRESLRRSRSRAEIDESWREFRRAGIERTRGRVARYFDACDPALQRLMRYAGMDPEHALLGSGNFNWTLLLSSKVFEPDPLRSYRLRPGVRSIWLKDVGGRMGGEAFFLVPDDPGLSEALRGSTAGTVETSRQTTNSWGLRGPEPDPDAPMRLLVLGDSFMQGMFIGDDQTPPECLGRYLRRALSGRVSVLNTGVMGYSPEQYYQSLIAFAERFRPHAVVVSIFANDCGDLLEAVGRGVGDWQEGKYWLEKIIDDCKAHDRPYLIVPAPFEPSVLGTRKPGHYPGALVDLLNLGGPNYLDPMDDFLNAHLESRADAARPGHSKVRCILFNDELGDQHLSAAGAEVWAESVGRRLLLLLKDVGIRPHDRADRVSAQDGPPHSVAAGRAAARIQSE